MTDLEEEKYKKNMKAGLNVMTNTFYGLTGITKDTSLRPKEEVIYNSNECDECGTIKDDLGHFIKGSGCEFCSDKIRKELQKEIDEKKEKKVQEKWKERFDTIDKTPFDERIVLLTHWVNEFGGKDEVYVKTSENSEVIYYYMDRVKDYDDEEFCDVNDVAKKIGEIVENPFEEYIIDFE